MHKNDGFTLIELLVVAAIISLMVGMGLVGYFQFNERQTMLADAEELKQFILVAKSKAKAGIVPEFCGTLNAYVVTSAACSGDLCIKSDCTGTNSQVSQIEFNNSLTTGGNVSFNALGGGVIIDSDKDFVLNSANYKYTLTVKINGEIIEGELEDN